MWGIVLLFVGMVLLLENFNVIEFYWRNVWSFWPVFLVIAGVNILFNKNKSETGNTISLAVLVVILGVVFFKGQQLPARHSWMDGKFGDDFGVRIESDKNNEDSLENMSFSTPYEPADSAKKTVFNISGGGTSFFLDGETDSLVTAQVERRRGNFLLQKESSDSLNTVVFKMKDKKSGWSMNDGGNNVNLSMNKAPEWIVNMNMGAGEVKFNFEDYKIRRFGFDGGAASLEIRVGDKLPVTDIVVKTGVAEVNLEVPESSGCRISTKTGLSAKDFPGFIKINNNSYETSNYSSAGNKVIIVLDGGLSSFEVRRY